MQRRITGGQQQPGTSSGPTVFALCPEQQLIAYGSDAVVHLVGAADLQPIATIKVGGSPSLGWVGACSSIASC